MLVGDQGGADVYFASEMPSPSLPPRAPVAAAAAGPGPPSLHLS